MSELVDILFFLAGAVYGHGLCWIGAGPETRVRGLVVAMCGSLLLLVMVTLN